MCKDQGTVCIVCAQTQPDLWAQGRWVCRSVSPRGFPLLWPIPNITGGLSRQGMSCSRQELCVLFTAHVCKPSHGRGAVIFSATNQLDTSSDRGVGDAGVACQDHGFFLVCHSWRINVAGEWVASVDSSGSVKHWTKGEAKNQAPTKSELHRQQESSGYVQWSAYGQTVRVSLEGCMVAIRNQSTRSSFCKKY